MIPTPLMNPLLGLTLSLCLSLLPSIEVSAKPNVLFIMVDDLGWNDVGYQGSEIKTPHIDELARTGVILDRYYAYPMCAPTRVALMTGRTGLRMGFDFQMLGSEGGLPLAEETLPQLFKRAGYQTAMAGKWHLGARDPKYYPGHRGFDQAYGHLSAGVDYYSHEFNGNLDWWRNGELADEEGYATELLTNELIERIKQRDPEAPFFFYAAYNAPHGPLSAPSGYEDRYSEISGQNRRLYAKVVDYLDYSIGRLLKTLEDEGLRQETLVIWASDNGGGRQGASNTPLRGWKSSVYEGGIRVPALVNWPGRLEGGRRIEERVSVHDWLPTLKGLAGIERSADSELDGEDIWPLLTGKRPALPRDLLIGFGGGRAAFRGDYKLLQGPPVNGRLPALELYDLKRDPSEKVDLASQKPEIVKELVSMIERYPIDLAAARNGSGPGRGRSPRGGPAGGRPQSAVEMVQRFDSDEDGRLSFDELPERRRQGLAGLDTDGDERLSIEELEPAFQGEGALEGRGPRQGGPRGPGSAERQGSPR